MKLIASQKRPKSKVLQQVPPSPQIAPSHDSAKASLPPKISTSITMTSTMSSDENDIMTQEKIAANRHLKQACSIIQRLMAAEQQEGGIKNMDRKQQSRYEQ